MSTVNSSKLLSKKTIFAAAQAMSLGNWERTPKLLQSMLVVMARTAIRTAIQQSQKTTDSGGEPQS